MAQHDYTLEDENGLAFLANLNEALRAIVSNNSGPDEPNPTYAFQWWPDTTTGILKQRNAANNDWIEILDLETGRPVGSVTQTSATGALLLAEGTDSQRPAPEDIPAGVAGVRGNSTSPTDYFLELWNRRTEAWDALPSRGWVQAITNLKLDADKNISLAAALPASGTAVGFTNIPSSAKRVTVLFSGVSTSGVSPIRLQLGTDLGYEASGYDAISVATYSPSGVAVLVTNNGFGTYDSNASFAYSGAITLNKISSTEWIANGQVTPNNAIHSVCGKKLLAGTLDRVRIVPANGTDTFDAGAVSISWE